MNFFDIKVNILPKIDPKCFSISESMERLKEIRSHDISKICAVPFAFDIKNQNPSKILIEIRKEASKILNFNIPELNYAAEYPINYYYSSPGDLDTINNTKYLMLKFPSFDFPLNLSEILNRFNNQGFIVIINNLESNILFRKYFSPEILIENNCLLNVDISKVFLSKKSPQIPFLKFLYEKKLITTLSGFSSKLNDGVIETIKRFSYFTGINHEKILNDFMWKNPNIIISSTKWESN